MKTDQQPEQVVDIKHIFFLLKPLLEPLVKELDALRGEIKPLADEMTFARTKPFIDSWPSISANVAYEVTYNGYKYLFMYSTVILTLVTSAGSTIAVPANQWVNITLPRGMKLTAQGIADATPVLVLVRATDELLSLSGVAGGQVTIADGADVTQGSKGDPAVTNPALSGSVISLLKGILTELEGSGSITANQGGAWTVTASEGGTWTVQPGNTQNTTPWLVQDAVNSIPYHNLSAATTNFTNVKTSAVQMYGFGLSNTSGSTIFAKFYDKASLPATTDTPKHTVQVPANSTVLRIFPKGLKFLTGFGWSATGGVADNDATAIAANCVIDFDLSS